MRSSRALTVLFRAAAGPRLGYGHLVRARVLAVEMGVALEIALRGGPESVRTARDFGWHVHADRPAILTTMNPDLVVIDDPSPSHVLRWMAAASALRIPVVVVQDARGHVDGADLVIDGSVVRPADAAPAHLQGPSFAILDPVVARLRRQRPERLRRHVLVALGGGAHVRSIGVEIATSVRACAPDVSVALAPGFSAARLPSLPAGCQWIDESELRERLATTTMAVVAGGITLYEACALGTPAVAVAVARAQQSAIAAMASTGAVVDATAASTADGIARAVTSALDLLDDPARRLSLSLQATRLVDGLGVSRVVAHLRALVMSRIGIDPDSKGRSSRGGAHAA